MNFYLDSSKPRGFDYKCKDCKKAQRSSPEGKRRGAERMRLWRAQNKCRDLETQRNYRTNNREKCREAVRKYDAANKEKRKAYRILSKERTNERLRKSGWYVSDKQKERKRKWRKENREKVREYYRRSNKQPMRALKLKMLSRVHDALRSQGLRKTRRVMDLVGCTTAELKSYISSRFKDGMSWEKIESGEIHIDHIKPCCSFNLSDPAQLQAAFHFTNLRPLWASENLKKAPHDRKLSVLKTFSDAEARLVERSFSP